MDEFIFIKTAARAKNCLIYIYRGLLRNNNDFCLEYNNNITLLLSSNCRKPEYVPFAELNQAQPEFTWAQFP